jgi:hypothetical protein
MENIEAFSDPDIRLGKVALWLRLAPDADFDPDGVVEKCGAILFERPLGEYGGALLLPALSYAARRGIASIVRLDDDYSDDDVEDAVRYAVQTIVTRPDAVEAVKDLIRQL